MEYFIFTIGVFIAFFLSLIILTKKGQNLADLIIGIWMIVIGIHLASYYGFITNLIFQYPFLLGINIPIPFLHGVFLYLYAEALIEPHKFKSKRWLVHFILPVCIILLYLPFYILSPKEKLKVFENEGQGYQTVTNISSVLLNISGILYIFITNRLLQKHKKRILNQFSNQEKINLDWLRFLSYTMGIIWILIIFVRNDAIIFTTASIFVIFIGYFGIKQVGIFTNQNFDTTKESKPIVEMVEENIINNTYAEKKKYAKSGLNQETAKELHADLQQLMSREKLFKEPELTLSDLATRLGVHPNYLSQAINEIEGINFYDYINNLRIEEFKKLVILPENQKFTLLAIAYECGFNSKSAFNRFFKKTTSLSPSEYIKQLKN